VTSSWFCHGLDSLSQLRGFCALAHVGSYSGAARVCGVSVSAITKHINLLEGILDCVLFEKVGNCRYVLTERGRILYERVVVALQSIAAWLAIYPAIWKTMVA